MCIHSKLCRLAEHQRDFLLPRGVFQGDPKLKIFPSILLLCHSRADFRKVGPAVIGWVQQSLVILDCFL